MSVTSGFFNSLNGDRKYNAEQMSSIFDGIINDGIFSNIGTAFNVLVAGEMNITVGIGRCWFNSTWMYNDSIHTISIEQAEPILDRIDVVAIEVNRSAAVRKADIKVIKGTPDLAPQPKEMERTEEVHQYCLAQVYVHAGVSELTQADITSKIGTEDTPFITAILETIDLNVLLGQWQGDLDNFVAAETTSFTNWFNAMKGQLSEDAAGRLQEEIDRIAVPLYGSCTTPAATTAKVVDSPGFELLLYSSMIVEFTAGVPAGSTLNINGTGAKPIWHKGAAILDNVITANSAILMVYDGAHYAVVSSNSSPAEMISDLWDTLTQYQPNDYCISDGFVWKCLVANIATQPTEGTYWTKVKLGKEVTQLSNDLTASNTTAGVSDTPFRFGCNDDGKFGYIIKDEGGADTVVPFNQKTANIRIASIIGNGQQGAGGIYAQYVASTGQYVSWGIWELNTPRIIDALKSVTDSSYIHHIYATRPIKVSLNGSAPTEYDTDEEIIKFPMYADIFRLIYTEDI